MGPLQSTAPSAMNEPTPSRPSQPTDGSEADARVMACLELQREMQELHARLQYLKLLLKMGVGQL